MLKLSLRGEHIPRVRVVPHFLPLNTIHEAIIRNHRLASCLTPDEISAYLE